MMQGGEEAEEDPAESQPTSEPVPSAAAMFLPTATVKRRQADVAGRVTIVEERVPLVEAHVQRLVREGFSREQCVEALDQEAGDLVAAARRLFEAFGCPKSSDNQTDSAGAAASASRAGEGEDNINAEADYYVVLGLAKDATQAQIKKSYYKLALRYHPDKSSADDAEAKFKIISQAYQVLSDPQKRQEYDQFGRESVEGSTVFADAKRHFALMFGGAAFQPFIGEMTMAFVSQLSQPEDEVEKVRQEMELLRFQQLKKKKLAQLLVERARGLIQKSGGRENFLYQARALRDELRKEPGADRLLQAIGWCYENAGLQVYRTHFGISGTFGGIGGHFMKLNKGFNSLKGRFQTIGSVFKVIGGAAGAASAMAAADELPTEQQEAERARIEAHMQTLMEDTIWSISKMEIQDTLWTAVENGLDGISVSETSKEGGTNTKSDTEDGKAASPPDRFEQKYLCEAVVLLGQLFQELPKTDPVGTEDKGPGNDSNSSAATASPPAAVPQRPEVVLPSHWLQLERPKPKPQPKVVSFFQNIFKKKQPQSPSSASTAAPAAAAVDQGSSNSVPVDSGSKPLPVDATSDVTI